MANHFSALKRARQTEKRSVRNRANTSRLRGALRLLRESLAKGEKAGAEVVFRQTVSALDKAVQKGVIHGQHRLALQVPPERAGKCLEIADQLSSCQKASNSAKTWDQEAGVLLVLQECVSELLAKHGFFLPRFEIISS